MRPKLDRWYPLKTRFKVVSAHLKDATGDLANQYRLIIEFPREHRTGWFPFELQLRDGEHSLTNYWCRPFGEREILDVISAVQRIHIEQLDLNKLNEVERKHGLRMFKIRMANFAGVKAQEEQA